MQCKHINIVYAKGFRRVSLSKKPRSNLASSIGAFNWFQIYFYDFAYAKRVQSHYRNKLEDSLNVGIDFQREVHVLSGRYQCIYNARTSLIQIIVKQNHVSISTNRLCKYNWRNVGTVHYEGVSAGVLSNETLIGKYMNMHILFIIKMMYVHRWLRLLRIFKRFEMQ
jgi:hypothetical protein